ncbi:MAG: hypothetical protein ACO1QR_14455, partial [Chthoniobacteraceae bacterium]
DLAIEGAARYATYLMGQVEQPGKFPDVTLYRSDAVAVQESMFWFLGRSPEIQDGTYRDYALVDEASKINLNTANQAMLEALPGMTPDFVAAIIEWRRSPNAETEEEDSMSFSSTPAKRGPFESVAELALIDGADPVVLWGEDANLNGVLDPNEDDSSKSLPLDNSDGKLDPGLFEYLTVVTREPNARSDGSAKINVRSASEERTAFFNETFGETRGAEILANIGGGQQPRSVLEFLVRTRMTPEEFDRVEADLTDASGEFRAGRINVNTASEMVLSCIPGIGVDLASTLVAARQNRDPNLVGMGWAAAVLGEEAAVQAGPFLTGRTYQVMADVAAVGRHGRGYRRSRFVIDSSTQTPRVVYRRDLSSLGWALGDEIRKDLISSKNE